MVAAPGRVPHAGAGPAAGGPGRGDPEEPGRWDDDPERDLATKKRSETKKPRLYRVLLHNDDYTTREFVIQILMDLFHKDRTEAYHIMMTVHTKGIGVAGVYTRDVADTKVSQVAQRAERAGMPLLCTMEPD